jgi:hypothetical protein
MTFTVGIPSRWRKVDELPGIRCLIPEGLGSAWLVVVQFHVDGESDSSYQVMIKTPSQRAAQDLANERITAMVLALGGEGSEVVAQWYSAERTSETVLAACEAAAEKSGPKPRLQ